MNRRRVFTVTILLLLLVVFPLASWWYLQRGMDYRIDSMKILSPKAQLPLAYRNLAGVKVIYPENADLRRLKPIQDHYGDRKDLVFTSFFSNTPESPLRDSLELSLELCAKQAYDFEETVFLCDSAGFILNAYLIPEDKDMAELTEHIAFVLPPEEKKDFLFKREREK